VRTGNNNGTPLILIVEDELAIVNLLELLLRNEGYQLHFALSLDEARRIWGKNSKDIDLVITDFCLSDGVGSDFAAEVLSESDTVKVIIITGLTASHVSLSQGVKPRISVIEKPFNPRELTRLVQTYLEEE